MNSKWFFLNFTKSVLLLNSIGLKILCAPNHAINRSKHKILHFFGVFNDTGIQYLQLYDQVFLKTLKLKLIKKRISFEVSKLKFVNSRQIYLESCITYSQSILVDGNLFHQISAFDANWKKKEARKN